MLAALLVVDLLVLVAGTAVGAVAARLDRVAVDLPDDQPGETWVVVGSDSRAHAPAADRARFGTADRIPGERADVVLVLHQHAGRRSLLSIPRDLLVATATGGQVRLAQSLRDGPQPLIDGLCATLGVAADHLVVVRFSGFLAAVDALGPLDIDVDRPVRDLHSGLQLDRAGRQAIDGTTALALVRSRRPEELVDGQWVPAPDGPERRAGWAGTVFSALSDRAEAARRSPSTLWRATWALAGAATVDDGTSLADLLDGLRGVDDAAVVPTSSVDGTALQQPDDRSRAALRDAGLGRRCVPASGVPAGDGWVPRRLG